MSIMTTIKDERERQEFAEKAARCFKSYPDKSTYGAVAPGEYFALRWGMGGDCVLVVRLDENFPPVNYQQLIKTVEPLKV